MDAVLLHGKPPEARYFDPEAPNPSDSFWLPSVARILNLAGIHTVRPEVPRPYNPTTPVWDAEVNKYPVTENTILIGNSAGAGHWADWMSRNEDTLVWGLVMVKPWLNPNKKYEFCEAPLDPDLAKRCLGGLAVVHNPKTDDEQIEQSLETVKAAFGNTANYIEVSEYGQIQNGRHVFPELVEIVVSMSR